MKLTSVSRLVRRAHFRDELLVRLFVRLKDAGTPLQLQHRSASLITETLVDTIKEYKKDKHNGDDDPLH